MSKRCKFLYETDESLLAYLVNKDDAYKYRRYDRTYIWVRCPICGKLSYRSVRAFVQRPTYCSICCDGMSYPNKFMLNVLLQLKLNVEPEKIFDWSNNRRYDDYIDDYSLIIENHGIQHYEKLKFKNSLSLENQQEIDFLKKQLAIQNNIKYYIEIDCRYSEMEWIKQSIMSSELPAILSFQEQDIDWIECDLRAKKSLLIETCKLWQQGRHNTLEIANELHISRATVNIYLKSGAKLGLCEYDPYVEMQKVWEIGRTQDIQKLKCKPIAVYNTIGMIAIFDGAVQLSEASDSLFGVHISRPMITSVCNGENQTNVGLRFQQITKEQYDKYYNLFNGHVNLEIFNPNIKYSSRQKPVVAIFADKIVDMFCGKFEAADVLTKKYGVKFSAVSISHTCLGQQKQHNGFTFKHITREEYEQYKMIKNNYEVVKEVIV